MRIKTKQQDWTKEEIDNLKILYPNTFNCDIALKLNRSKSSINNKANKLKLIKTKEFKSICIAKRNKMVARDINYNLAKKQALLCKTRSELQRIDNSCYNFIRKNNLFEDLCGHMIPMQYSIPQLMIKVIMDSLLQEKSTYNDRKIVKPYEIDVYYQKFRLGFEYNGKYWHLDNERDKLKTNECKNKNIKIIYILENNRRYEEDIKNQLKQKLIEINNITNNQFTEQDIDKCCVDSTFTTLYDKESLIQLAKSYTDYKTFKAEHALELRWLTNLKIVDQATEHMKNKKRFHTIESCIGTISKYEFLLDFIINERGTYAFIIKNKLVPLLSNLKRKNKFKKNNNHVN